MARKDALRLRITKTVAADGLDTLKTEPVQQGQIQCMEQIAWEIDTVLSGGNTRARLYIEGHGYNHDLAEQQSPAADNLYEYVEKPYLHAGERLVLELDEAQEDTVAEMLITGYTEFVKE